VAGLSAVDHLVVLMLQNRSFDHMIGFLYADVPDTPPFAGLMGDKVMWMLVVKKSWSSKSRQTPRTPTGTHCATRMRDTLQQTNSSLGAPKTPCTCDGNERMLVTSFASDLQSPRDAPLDGATPGSIMAMYTTRLLPVLSGLARGHAVCDRWFASVPSETIPNRAFALAGTSLGRVSDSPKFFDTKSIFGAANR
jgi:phospholipase C